MSFYIKPTQIKVIQHNNLQVAAVKRNQATTRARPNLKSFTNGLSAAFVSLNSGVLIWYCIACNKACAVEVPLKGSSRNIFVPKAEVIQAKIWNEGCCQTELYCLLKTFAPKVDKIRIRIWNQGCCFKTLGLFHFQIRTQVPWVETIKTGGRKHGHCYVTAGHTATLWSL